MTYIHGCIICIHGHICPCTPRGCWLCRRRMASLHRAQMLRRNLPRYSLMDGILSLSLSLHISLAICLSVCLSVCLPVSLFLATCIYRTDYLCILYHIYIHLPVYSTTYVFLHHLIYQHAALPEAVVKADLSNPR